MRLTVLIAGRTCLALLSSTKRPKVRLSDCVALAMIIFGPGFATVPRRCRCIHSSKWLRRVILVVTLLSTSLASSAQSSGPASRETSISRNRNSPTLSGKPALIALIASLPPSLTLNVSEIQFNIKITDPNQDSSIMALPVTSSWVLNSTTTSVNLVAYFQSQQALSDSLNHFVPADHVMGGLNSEPLLPFEETSSEGRVGSSRNLFREPISAGNYRNCRTDTLRIQVRGIADVGAPEGNYRGILHLRLTAY
jgi:hypothetical protein